MAQNIRNASVNSASSASDERWHLQFKELERIQDKLEDFLSRQESRQIAAQIHDIALEVDQEIDQILQDPLVGRLYEYDGRFFTPKHGWGFYRAFNGFHILK